MPKLHLVPECHAETAMVKVVLNDGYVNHADGIHSVSHKLIMEDIGGFINIGFVDKDKKNIPPYFDEFEEIEQISSVIFKKHPQSNDYLFIVQPAIEKFILAQLNEIGKKPSDYGLPDDFNKFRHKMKKISIQKDEGYLSLLQDIKTGNTSGIKFIVETISKL